MESDWVGILSKRDKLFKERVMNWLFLESKNINHVLADYKPWPRGQKVTGKQTSSIYTERKTQPDATDLLCQSI